MTLKQKLSNTIHRPMRSRKAYNLWAASYDSGDENLVFKFDNEILDTFIIHENLSGKTILDYGCGTGRNWERFFSLNPKKIIGCDSSFKMLQVLKLKYPNAEIHLISEKEIPSFKIEKVDIIFSTLVAAQVKDLRQLFEYWKKILKPEGIIIITDLHPIILSSGGKRTFNSNGKTIEIKNYIHTLDKIEKICFGLNLRIIEKIEKFVNDDVKDFYLRKNALHVFEKFNGMPLVYGLKIKYDKT